MCYNLPDLPIRLPHAIQSESLQLAPSPATSYSQINSNSSYWLHGTVANPMRYACNTVAASIENHIEG